MLAKEDKVTKESEYFIFTPSQTALNMFFYPLCFGVFHYLPGYFVKRSSFDSFLLMEITAGECIIEDSNIARTAKSGQLILINCYKLHCYGSQTGCTAKWLHFDGKLAEAFFTQICCGEPFSISDEAAEFEIFFDKLFQNYKAGNYINECELSLSITTLLSHMITGRELTPIKDKNQELINECLKYINDNFADNISLTGLAERYHLSPFYFSRLFKAHTGHTPHEYLVTTRLNHSKYLLKNTSLTIKEICFACGFASESRFCTAFRDSMEMTPSEYKIEDSQ